MATWSTHTPKWSVKWLKIPLDPVQPESTLRVNTFKTLSPRFGTFLRLFRPVTLHDLGPVAPQLPASLSLSPQLSSHQQAAKKYPRPFCVYMPIKECEQEGKADVINENGVRGTDGNGNGDAKVAQKRPVKR